MPDKYMELLARLMERPDSIENLSKLDLSTPMDVGSA
jgi:hypothetical protein